ncbi:MAG: hypothetical protein HYT80_04025 [Euryarchaeota archaeon]|nr:hypothetical protein [Euryarchaeota archaeon]
MSDPSCPIVDIVHYGNLWAYDCVAGVLDTEVYSVLFAWTMTYLATSLVICL